jgi:hypothetical protein
MGDRDNLFAPVTIYTGKTSEIRATLLEQPQTLCYTRA